MAGTRGPRVTTENKHGEKRGSLADLRRRQGDDAAEAARLLENLRRTKT